MACARSLLKSGEALFDVAKDRARPFVVIAGDRKVIAVGTSFEVRREEPAGSTFAVTLVEGRVAIEPISWPDALPSAGAERSEAAESGPETSIHRRHDRDAGFPFHRESHRMAARRADIRRRVAERGSGGIQSLRHSPAGDRRTRRSKRCASAAYLESATPTALRRSMAEHLSLCESSLARQDDHSHRPRRSDSQ